MKYLSSSPFSVAVCASRMTNEEYDIVFLNKDEFCAKYSLAGDAYDVLLDEIKKGSD